MEAKCERCGKILDMEVFDVDPELEATECPECGGVVYNPKM